MITKPATVEQATEMVNLIDSDDWTKCPVCNDKPLIKCFPGSHNTRRDEDGDCFYCDEDGDTMCPCQDL